MNKFYYLALFLPILFLAQSCKEEPPEFISVEPEFGSEKQLIVLKGNNIGEIRELLFNGEPIAFNTAYNSDVALLFRIPVGTPLGQTTVTVRTDDGSFTFDFLVSEKPPTIAKFTPRSGDPGDVITITGRNYFEPPLEIYFRTDVMLDEELELRDSVKGEVIYVSATKDTMQVVVPEGAATGTMTVVANGGPVRSLVNFFTFSRQLVTDFDGNGLRSDNDALVIGGRSLDQLDPNKPYIRNSLPNPIDGNFLQLSGMVPSPRTTIGSIQTPMNLDSFEIEASIGNASLEFDLNSGGRAGGYIGVALQEQGSNGGDYTFIVKMNDAAGWNKVTIPMVRFKNFQNIVVTPGEVNAVKFILLDQDRTSRRLEANIDNVKLVEQR